jgi:hypothetical protein
MGNPLWLRSFTQKVFGTQKDFGTQKVFRRCLI